MGIGIPLLDTIGAIGSGLINKNAANKAQEAQERALTNARGDITQTYGEGRGYQQPYYDIGTQGLRNLSGMLGRGEFNGPAYNYQMGQAPNEQFNFEADPGYQWRLQQGANAINSGAAAAGNRLSGATMKALQRYGQNFAANEYQNAYNRYNTNRNFAQGQYEYGTSTGMQNAMNRYNAGNQQAQQRYNMYNTLANYGQAAGNNLSNLTTGYGQNLADLSIQRGNVQSAGIQGRANAYNQMLTGGVQGLGQMFGGGGGGGGGGMGALMGSGAGSAGAGGAGAAGAAANGASGASLMQFLPFLL